MACAIKGFKHTIDSGSSLEEILMHEFHYAKENVIARTFHKGFRMIAEFSLLFGLMAARVISRSQSTTKSPSAPAWDGASTHGGPANLVAGERRLKVFHTRRKKESKP